MIEMRDSKGPDIQPAADQVSAMGLANWTRQGGQQWARLDGYVAIQGVDAEARVTLAIDHSQVTLVIRTYIGDYNCVWLLGDDGYMKPSKMAWEPYDETGSVTEPVAKMIKQANDALAALIVEQMRWVNATYRGGQA
jgi:hypothetical protein